MFLKMTKIFLDSTQNFKKGYKELDFHQNNILQYFFFKVIAWFSNHRVCKIGLNILTGDVKEWVGKGSNTFAPPQPYSPAVSSV